MAVIYTTVDDLLVIVNKSTLAALCEAPEALPSESIVIERVRSQASHVGAEIESALGHRFEDLPAPFVTANTLTGQVELTPGSITATGTGSLFLAEIAAGEGIGNGLGTWAQVKSVESDLSLTLEQGWPGLAFTGSPIRGEIHQVIRWIARFLTLESLYARSPSFRGAAAWKDDVDRAREMLEEIREGSLTLFGVQQFFKGRCDALGLDYWTEDIYGFRTRITE